MSKFSHKELPYYQEQFFGCHSNPSGFIEAWLHHQNRNKHHWEYWIPRTGHSRCDTPYPDNEPLDVPIEYVYEMIADWLAAGRAYERKWPIPWKWDWLVNNWGNIKVSPLTLSMLELKLIDIGVQFEKYECPICTRPLRKPIGAKVMDCVYCRLDKINKKLGV